jgi:hypothetical protein
MKFKDIDIYEMPEWLQNVTTAVMNQCGEMLKKNPQYNEFSEEGEELLEKNRFISDFLSTMIDKKMMEDLPSPSKEDLEELSRYLLLENDQMELMNIQYYLLGSRHTLEFLELVGIL